jgi:hypothetical protein
LVFLRFDFDVANVLALIRRESQDELSVFGEEDE